MPLTSWIAWKSIRPERNRSRFYALYLGWDLWGQRCVLLRWGRLLDGCKEKFLWVSEEELPYLLQSLHLHWLRYGYQLVHGVQTLHAFTTPAESYAEPMRN